MIIEDAERLLEFKRNIKELERQKRWMNF